MSDTVLSLRDKIYRIPYPWEAHFIPTQYLHLCLIGTLNLTFSKPTAHTESTRQYRPNLGGGAFHIQLYFSLPKVTPHEGDNCTSEACKKPKEDRRSEPSLGDNSEISTGKLLSLRV